LGYVIHDGGITIAQTINPMEKRPEVLRAGGPQIGIDRFRPNIHVDGCKAFEEDEMKALVLSSSDAQIVMVMAVGC